MYTISFDLDGVLAACKPEAERLLGKAVEKAEDFWAVANTEGFFLNLPLLPDAAALFTGVISLAPEGTNIRVLTATGNNYVDVSHQKRKWVAKMFRGCFSYTDIITTRKGTDKAAYAHPTHILIDDTPKVIEAWEAAGGIGILHTDAESTIAKLKNLLNNA